MANYTLPDEWRYTASHLWVDCDGTTATVGLTEHGQERHGRVFHVGLPAVGAPATFGLPLGSLQSAGYGLTQLFPPVQGAVAAINEDLWARPGLVNEDPLGDGWLARIALADAAELAQLETADGYRRVLSGEQAPGRLPQHLLEAAAPVFLIDEQRRVLACNASAEQFIGLTSRQMQHGPLCSELFGCHHDDGTTVTKGDCPGLCSLLNLEPVVDAEYLVTNAAGGETRVRATYTPHVAPGLPRRAIVTLSPVD